MPSEFAISGSLSSSNLESKGINRKMSSSSNVSSSSSSSSKLKLRIEDIPELYQPHCKIKNPEYVEKILNELCNGGNKKLQFITDFDYTITKQRLDNGEEVKSSFGILNACKSLPKNYLDETKRINGIYRPIEIDPNIPHDEKLKYMIEWWTLAGELLKGFPLNENEIDEVAYHYRNAIRDGTHKLFEKLNEMNVPILVFSAGLGNSVQSVLKHAKLILPNVKIVSNFIQFNNGLCNGFQDNIIHVFNKNELALKGTEYYDMVHDRDHVIVMGDSLGDAGMANGVSKTSYVLKIGFLFDHPEQNLERYMNTFDIVLVDDQTMNVPNAIIQLIAKRSSSSSSS